MGMAGGVRGYRCRFYLKLLCYIVVCDGGVHCVAALGCIGQGVCVCFFMRWRREVS